ncbi:unnamed protein product [Ixodes hexagonus]
MDYAELSTSKIDTEKLIAQVGAPDCGAISVFIGTTRNHFEGKTVLKLSYEAYGPMAKRELVQMCADVRERWNVKNVAVVHRLGEVPVGEASIVIAVSSAHREESQAAVKWIIDQVKSRLPVWKKEIYADGVSEWKENKECFWNAA